MVRSGGALTRNLTWPQRHPPSRATLGSLMIQFPKRSLDVARFHLDAMPSVIHAHCSGQNLAREPAVSNHEMGAATMKSYCASRLLSWNSSHSSIVTVASCMACRKALSDIAPVMARSTNTPKDSPSGAAKV
jgi:hypothetical protein